MNPIAAHVKEAVRRITVLNRQVQERLRPSPSMVKRVPFFANVPFTWVVPDMGLQSLPWVNGAEDTYITAATYACNVGNLIGPTANEFGIAGFTHFDPRVPTFDFEWNYKLPSSGLTYVSQANGAQYADRRALGNLMRGEPLQFAEPLVVPAGDAVLWIVRPTMFSPTVPLDLGTVVDLSMIMCGYRTGTMAEADYDRR